jgi:putative transposase
MKNHYHLLLSERTEGGITQFIRKLNIGYAKYFNERYDRVGTLFQGRTKKVPITNDRQFFYILHYLHLNPLDHRAGSRNWREGKIKDSEEALAYLSQYRWSSFLDYAGRSNFPSILTTSLFKESFKDYQKEIVRFVKDMKQEQTAFAGIE